MKSFSVFISLTLIVSIGNYAQSKDKVSQRDIKLLYQQVAPNLKIYISLTDCSNGTFIYFSSAVTPFPILLNARFRDQNNLTELDNPIFWVGTTISATKAGQQLALKYTTEEFSNLTRRTEEVINTGRRAIDEEQTFDSSDLGQFYVIRKEPEAFHDLMIRQVTDHSTLIAADLLLSLRLDKTKTELPNFVTVQDVKQVQLQVRIKHSISGIAYYCAEIGIDIISSQKQTTISQRNRQNFENYFVTNQVRGICPEKSVDLGNGNCQCAEPHMGPLCLFQCNETQMKLHYDDCADCSTTANKFSRFQAEDYIYHCFLTRNISIVKSFQAHPIGIDEITIRWTESFIAWTISLGAPIYRFSIVVKEAYSPFHTTFKKYIYANIGNTSYSLRRNCHVSSTPFIEVDCDKQLSPFTIYSIHITFLFTYRGNLFSFPAGSVNVTSTEIQIEDAYITEKNHIFIKWIVIGYCPENIDSVMGKTVCNGDEQNFALNGTVSLLDCRLGNPIASISDTPITLNREADVFVKVTVYGTQVTFRAWSNDYKIRHYPKSSSYYYLGTIITVAALTVLVIVFLYAFIVNRRQKVALKKLFDKLQESSAQTTDIESTLKLVDTNRALIEQTDRLPYLYRYEIEFSRLVWGQELGQGNFGIVKAGKLRQRYVNISTEVENVAIKQLKSRNNSVQDIKILLDELKVMIAIGTHVNIVRLIGAVTRRIPQGELYIIMELCERGSLLSVLKEMSRSLRAAQFTNPQNFVTQEDGYEALVLLYEEEETGEQLLQTDLMLYAYQIANGMVFISSKNVIHRDLAARNVLVTSNYIIKIADCGLARQNKHYTMSPGGGMVPIASMALETFENNYYSIESDVWSYGVLLWEIFTLGSDPLDGHYPSRFKQIHKFLKNGYRLNSPKHAPPNLYNDLMYNCWKEDPLTRPTFKECRSFLEEQLNIAASNELRILKINLDIAVFEFDQYVEMRTTSV